MRPETRFPTRQLGGLCILVLWLASSAYGAALQAEGPSSRTLRTMARAYMAFGQYDKAQPLAEKALAQARCMDAGDEEEALCMLDLATVYQNLDRLAEARDLFAEGLALQRRTLWQYHPYIAYSLRMLADVYRQMTDFETAGRTLDEAMALLTRTHLPDDPVVWMFRVDHARLLMDQGQLDQAQGILEQAVEVVRSTYGPEHLCTANVLRDRATLRLRQGRVGGAREDIDETLRLQGRYFGDGATSLVPAWLLKAQICYAAGQDIEAETCLTKALETVGKSRDLVQIARLSAKIAEIRTQAQYANAPETASSPSDS